MTGLLYALVVALWVAVIVPTYLKRHDRRELERAFASPLTEQLVARRAAWAARPRLTPRERAFLRRRRVLMTLLTTVFAAILLAATNRLPWYAPVLPVAATVAFLRAAVRVATRQHATALAPRRAQPSAADAWRAATVAVATTSAANPRAWRPAAPVLPTYLTAAPAPVRGDQRPWTSTEMLAEAAAVREQRTDRIREAQQRFEQARAAAMERARQAALDASRQHEAQRGQRVVNE